MNPKGKVKMKLYSIKNVADMCKVSRCKVEYAVSRGAIPAWKAGAHWVWTEAHLQEAKKYCREREAKRNICSERRAAK